METRRGVISLAVIFWLTATSGAESEEGEVTTEGFEFPTYDATANVTESPDDNGMAIGEIPREQNPDVPATGLQSKEEEQSAVEQQEVLVSFPENHKNFTPSQYLGDQDFPPYYNHLSTYQQQYKNYNEQKQMYNRKPIKFEENVLDNYYLPQSPNGLGGGKKTESVRVNRNPFPYAFENEQTRENWYKDHGSVHLQTHNGDQKVPEGWYKTPEHLPEHQESYRVHEKVPEEWYKTPEHLSVHEQPHKGNEGWYKHTGHVSAYENPSNEHVFHQDNALPHHLFSHSYPRGEKFYKHEVVHFDHRPLKKDEKGNAWKKVFHVLTALVPLGLLLASLTPNVISINSTATTKATRQRSEDAPGMRFREEDVLKLMKKYGVESLTEAQCEDRIICELATEGGKNSAGPVEKGFWFLANQTPWDIAEKAGMNDLFRAIKTGNCETYRCHARVKSSSSSSSSSNLEKKPTRKQKITK